QVAGVVTGSRSPKISEPALRALSSVTVALAVRSMLLKSATAPVPSATVALTQAVVSLHTPLPLKLQEPSAARADSGRITGSAAGSAAHVASNNASRRLRNAAAEAVRCAWKDCTDCP